MITKKKKFTLPEYRERKPIYEKLGYKEVSSEIKDTKIVVIFEIDETNPHYPEIAKLERKLYPKGPSFIPIIGFVVVTFALLSVFMVLLAKEGKDFDLVANGLAFILPALISLFLDVAYTYFYFTMHRKIIENAPLNIEDITSIVDKLKNK